MEKRAMHQITGLSRDRYALRRMALSQIAEVIKTHKLFRDKVPSRIKRIYNIVNQSDPDDLFGHFTEKQLRAYVFGNKPLPKYLTATGKSGSPDAKIFKEQRRFFAEETHHVHPLAQNVNAINSNWTDSDLFIFHKTLREAQTGAGSSRLGLIGLLKDEHTGKESIHADAGGTKVAAFESLTQTDPELAAGEFILNNWANSEAAKWWINERGRKTMQVLDAPEGSPLQQALMKSKGNRGQFDLQLQALRNGVTETVAPATANISIKNGALHFLKSQIPGPIDLVQSALDSNVGQKLGQGDIPGALIETGKNFVGGLQQQFGTPEGLATTAAMAGAAAVAPAAAGIGAGVLGAGAAIQGAINFEEGFTAGQRGVSVDQIRKEKEDMWNRGMKNASSFKSRVKKHLKKGLQITGQLPIPF